ncbi:MAG: hypothetical protein M1429_03265, partial [Patescibacteria group bacterium]|nr:hypothetical protein [Patescibacteria group bacterium]
LSEMPKIDDILTKAQKDRVLKLPPKIGETYYREIQTPGDVRWYLGGGSTDQPLSEEIIQEKIQKHEMENSEPWQKERFEALETKEPQLKESHDEEIEKDKADLLNSFQNKTQDDVQHLKDGQTIKL